MAPKKKTKHSSEGEGEIDLRQLSIQLWYNRKLIFFGTIFVALISLLIVFLTNKTFSSNKQSYVLTILSGDLGENNSRIVSALKSREYISDTLLKLGLEIDPAQINNNLIIQNKTNPLKESLQERIISLEDKDIKNLALSSNELTSIIESLNDKSENVISIKFFHLPLSMSYEQANDFLITLTDSVNEKILLRTNRENLNLNSINTKDFENYFNTYEQLARYTDMINTIQTNVSIMRRNYEDLLIGIDLSEYSNLANISQKLLYELSKNLGNTIAIDTLNINISNKNRDIEDLKESLEILNSEQSVNINTGKQKNIDEQMTNNTTQLDGAIFDKILNLGSEVSLITFRLNTLSKIQILQSERNALIKQKDLLDLPMQLGQEELTIENVGKRIKLLSYKLNELIKQVRNFTQPRAALEVIKNPELVVLKSRTIIKMATHITILTLLGFFILSIFSLLLPSRKN
ncbi:hypothetical protein IDH35_04915 [Pelagibacterales bacterium SAG-MED49]|nr:hypothetical protein [Pelagibacterales bacterium SAG-MED49]